MINLPDSGKLTIFGKDMTSQDTTESDILEARRNVGMVFQNPDNQIVATIVEEDVAFGCENLGMPPEGNKKKSGRSSRSRRNDKIRAPSVV